MLGTQLSHRRESNKPATLKRSGAKRYHEIGPQLLRHPAIQRHRETLFGTVNDVARQVAFCELLDERFGHATLVHLQRWIEASAPSKEVLVVLRYPGVQR